MSNTSWNQVNSIAQNLEQVEGFFGISSDNLEFLLRTLWRYGEIGALYVRTSSEKNYAITPFCSFFNNFIIPLELMTLLGFPVIPFKSNDFPPEENFMKRF